ncbi:MAG TPA: LssY C-terminal domain-containing protein [Candidatus Acidoferrum sp.]|nr:LssY C-terminal domain-containing protein [Candidatus Acidoferrum sp.]
MQSWARTAVHLVCLSAGAALPGAVRAQQVSSGTVLEVRLEQPVSTIGTKRGDAVRAALIAPVEQDGQCILPPGTEVLGTIRKLKRIGLGLVRERALLQLQFDTLVLPDGSRIAFESKVLAVENSRETVLADGTIRGIRATDSYGHRATGLVTNVAAVDPLFALFAFSASSAVLRFPDAEIYYPTGTDLQLALSRAVSVPLAFPLPAGPVAQTSEELQSLAEYVNRLPFRTRTKSKGIPSDVTNLVFFGTEEQLRLSFANAGWSEAAPLSSESKFQTVRALAESRGYTDAPVSVLLLNDQAPAFAFEKTLNTFSKRHHVRVWKVAEKWQGQTVWTAAATQDISLGFSQKKTLIHRVQREIDQERSKIVNDLAFARCIDSVELVDRPHSPRNPRNATGEQLVTDGRIAVLRLTDCEAPLQAWARTPGQALPGRGNALGRGVRQFNLTLRNSILRDNILWQGYDGSRFLWKTLRRPSKLNPGSAALSPALDVPEGLGEPGLSLANRFEPSPVERKPSRPRLPEVELSLDGGQFRPLGLGDLYLASVNPDTGEVDVFQFPMRIEKGVLLGASVTVNSRHWISHEIYAGTLQANLRTGGGDGQVDRLHIRTTGYQLQVPLFPSRWRLRPYVLAGPSLTSYRFKNIKLNRKQGLFLFGLRRVGVIVGAINSAGVAPLDGGSVFQVGLTYGGGFKYRMNRMFELRGEYRETYARDPDFFNKQSVNLSSLGITSAQDPGARQHGTYSFGVSFTP